MWSSKTNNYQEQRKKTWSFGSQLDTGFLASPHGPYLGAQKKGEDHFRNASVLGDTKSKTSSFFGEGSPTKRTTAWDKSGYGAFGSAEIVKSFKTERESNMSRFGPGSYAKQETGFKKSPGWKQGNTSYNSQ